MTPERVTITLRFSADLDAVPGWGHAPDDWVALVRRELERNSHYNTKVEIVSVETSPEFRGQFRGQDITSKIYPKP
jgi:hypothetical protein